MALIRVAQYGAVPGPVTDYQAQNAHLQAFTNQLMTQQFILDSGTAQPVIKQGCYVSHGGSLYVADADTAITGSPADGSVYIRVSGTTSLTVEFVTDISGYTGILSTPALTSGSYTLLPYLIIKAGSLWSRFNFNNNGQAFGGIYAELATITGAISGASLDTGQGANELYPMDQGVKTTDSPTFASIDTGFGYAEAHPITYQFESAPVSGWKYIPPMAIGEIKFYHAWGDSSRLTIGIRTIAEGYGTYYVYANTGTMGRVIATTSTQTIANVTGHYSAVIIRVA